jgi:TRAP-type C4-dicarboxylate transport system permease small subunit
MKLKFIALALLLSTASAHACVIEGLCATFFALVAIVAGKETHDSYKTDKPIMNEVVQEIEKNALAQKLLPHAEKLKGWLEKMNLIKDPAWYDFKYWYYRTRGWSDQYQKTIFCVTIAVGSALLSLYFLKEAFGKTKKEVQHIEIETSDHHHHHPIA